MRVVLIGEHYEASENLALAMLEAALEARGHAVVRVGLGSLPEIGATASEALAARPDLIGLSINYQVSALTALALGHCLRAAGYTGHLTAGGEFATIHPHEILRDCPLDSLICFDGERPLAELADALARGSALAEIPGLLLGRRPRAEAGDPPGEPARVWERPFPFWAARHPPLPRHLGIPSAAILGSRGCSYHCVYCCIAALNRTAKQQAKAAGHLEDWAMTRHRPVPDLADEMAHLRRKHGVRLFRFEDDCLLGDSPEEARPIVDALARELGRRDLGDVALTLKLRPDSLDREVVRRLAGIGLIHGFIGIEALTDATLKRLGRSYRSAEARDALAALEESGIPAYFNALVIGPDTTLESLAADLDALEGVHGFPVEVVRLILYAGTPMFRQLETRGAVSGNYLHWRYTFADPGVEAVARVLAHLPTRRTGAYCVAKRLADLEFNLAVARRFLPHVQTGAMVAETAPLKRASNQDTVALVRRLIRLAGERPSPAEQLEIARQLAIEVGARDQLVIDRIDALVARLEELASADGRSRRTAYLRSGLATAGVCFQLALAPIVAHADPELVAQTPPVATEAAPVATEAAPDAGTEGSGSEPTTLPSAPACVAAAVGPDRTAQWESALFSCDAVRACDVREIVFVVDSAGRVVHVKTTTGALAPHVSRCILDALAGVCFPDVHDELVHHTVWGPCD